MKSTRPLGIITLIIGVLLFMICYSLSEFIFIRKVFSLSIFFVCVGVSFAVFAGKPLTVEQKKDPSNEYKYIWNNAPLIHKCAWVAGILGGFILAQNFTIFF